MRLSRLYPILDSAFIPGSGSARREWLNATVAGLLEAGVTLLQYRNKTRDEKEILSDALALRAIAPPDQCTLILNDYPRLAVEAGFDGVHLGQEDMAVAEARAIVGPDKIIGLSTHNPVQLVAADRTSADYLAIGPVFATVSKANPDPVVGLEGVRRARELTEKPLIAIGGINVENCRAVLDAGAASVAVISNLFKSGPMTERFTSTPAKIASDFFMKLR
jgi:thiamine-phosphate pyrophosphorylase